MLKIEIRDRLNVRIDKEMKLKFKDFAKLHEVNLSKMILDIVNRYIDNYDNTKEQKLFK